MIGNKELLRVHEQRRFQPREQFFLESKSVDEVAAERVIDLVRRKPTAVMILPTDEVSNGMYHEIEEAADHGRKVDFSGVTVFNFDEYFLIGRGDQMSRTQYMERHFYNHVNIPRGQRIAPDGQYPLYEREANRIQGKLDKLMKSRVGIDLAVLGIGKNGQLGFNEPGSSFNSRTRLVHLTNDESAVGFTDPEHARTMAITIGLGKNGIRSAQEIILLAKGSDKQEALYRAFREKPTSAIPASVLQFCPRVTVVADYEAGELLAKS